MGDPFYELLRLTTEMECSSTANLERRCWAKSLLRFVLAIVLLVASSVALTAAGFSQQLPGSTAGPASANAPIAPKGAQPTGAKMTKEHKPKRKRRLPAGDSIAAAPVPISSPAIGSGVIPVLGFIFPIDSKDKVSPPSDVGVGGLITSGGSRGFGVGAQLYLRHDRYEITTFYAHGNLDYTIYSPGLVADLKLPLEQTGDVYRIEVLRKLKWEFFAGPRFTEGRSFLSLGVTSVDNFPIPPDVGINTNLTAIGVRLTRDTSTNRFYPTNGTSFSSSVDIFSENIGSKYSFQSYKTQFDKYISLNKKQVLAYDAYLCATGGAPPFYGNCIYGTSNELRGYTAGKYFDRTMMATQLEYRLVLPWRFGVVGFGGVGGVLAGKSQLLQKDHFLPDGGFGFRFDVSPKYHVNLRGDFGWGNDGHTFGMGMLEAF
jgi:Omp85 superfamily domain